MVVNRFHLFAVAAVVSIAAAFTAGFRRRSQKLVRENDKLSLGTWEGEGGKPAAPVADTGVR